MALTLGTLYPPSDGNCLPIYSLTLSLKSSNFSFSALSSSNLPFTTASFAAVFALFDLASSFFDFCFSESCYSMAEEFSSFSAVNY